LAAKWRGAIPFAYDGVESSGICAAGEDVEEVGSGLITQQSVAIGSHEALQSIDSNT